VGKEAILGEGVVRDEGAARQKHRYHLLLPVAAQQEKHLGLEGVAGAISVEAGEEGVFLEDLQ